MRIVAGKFKGRSILSPGEEPIRPTSDRVRQAIFNILAHAGLGAGFDGARVLDLFAGTGALGIEALSRGAAFCLFVESNPVARGLIRRSLAMLNADRSAEISSRDATALGAAPAGGAFDLVFIDPPYGKELGARALLAAARGGWLAPRAIAVLEEQQTAKIVLPARFSLAQQRVWGDTQVVFARYEPTSEATGSQRKRL